MFRYAAMMHEAHPLQWMSLMDLRAIAGSMFFVELKAGRIIERIGGNPDAEIHSYPDPSGHETCRDAITAAAKQSAGFLERLAALLSRFAGQSAADSVTCLPVLRIEERGIFPPPKFPRFSEYHWVDPAGVVHPVRLFSVVIRDDAKGTFVDFGFSGDCEVARLSWDMTHATLTADTPGLLYRLARNPPDGAIHPVEVLEFSCSSS